MPELSERQTSPRRANALPTSCYLCGKTLDEPIDWDHVPPKQLYAPEVRKAHNPSGLLTIPVHGSCNKSYQLDEDYFVYSLMPFARGSYAGNAIYNESLSKYRTGQRTGLAHKVLREFEPRPSGLILPGNKVIKRFEGARISRIAWKITRGLYFHHHNRTLSEDLVTWVSVTAPGERPPEHFLMFTSLPDNEPHGRYPGVFAYRFQNFTEEGNTHYWAMLLWDRIIVTVLFHDPECTCERCTEEKSKVATANNV